ncbi:MAG: hypothetical protein ACE5Q6_24370 [Dehalococcoidia bacterium]
MAILGNLPNGFTLVEEAVAGPASYATASPPTIDFDDLAQNVEQVISVTSDDGRHVQVASLSGRTLTFRVRGLDAAGMADGDPMLEVPDATNLSGNTYRALAYGR